MPIVLNVSIMLSPRLPENMLGSVELSYVNSPGSAQTSTTLPWSTIIIHCPSATAMPEPLVIMLSLPLVLDERPETRFCPLTTSTSLSIASQ